ncbi:putative ribonuclease H-like domain-containing protein [Tanacetum coccineum]
MWDAIKSRFGGNDESKKMQKYILKQQFEGFSVSNTEGLHKGYDRSLPSAWSQVSLIMRTKPGVDSLSFDDLYNNLRAFESDVKGSTASSSSSQNVAFISENTSSTNENQGKSRQQEEGCMECWNQGWEQNWKEGGSKALVTIDGEGVDWTNHSEKMKNSFDGMQNSSESDNNKKEAQKEKEDLKAKAEKWHNSSKNLSKLLNTQMSANDKFGLGYGDHRYDGILSYENEVLQSVFMNKESELEKQPLYDRSENQANNHAGQQEAKNNAGTNDLIDAGKYTSAQTALLYSASPHEGLSLSDPTNPEQDDSEIPPLEDIYQNSTDALILGDPTSAVQTRSKVNKSSGAYAFVSYVQKQRRNNHKDFQHCLFACFLSQHEPKKISEALEDESTIDKTLFIKKDKHDIILVQVYVDDIIFGSTKKSWCDEFEALMKSRFQMSSMGELTFFLGLQVKQKADGIFISQDKYVAEILKKFDFANVKTASTPIETQKPLVKDEEASDVDVHLYRSMIGSLMYLTASRLDIMYLKGKPKLGLWYPRVSSFDLEAYSDSDYAGANLDRKSTTGGCQFLGNAKSRPLWLLLLQRQNMLLLQAVNPVYHSKTKHIAIRHHFIRDAYEKKLIQVLKIHTDDNVADLLTKAFDVSRESLRRVFDGTEALMLPTLFILWLAPVSTNSAKVSTAIETLKKNTAKALISLLTTITISTTMAVLDSCPKHNMVAYLEKSEGNAEFHEIIDFLMQSSIHHALTVSPVVSTTFVEQFWTSAKSKMINNVRHITAKVAGKPVSISEASIRSDLLFDDANGIDSLPNQAIFDAIQLMGYEGDLTVLTFNKALFSPQWRFLFHTMNHCLSSKSTSWDQIPTNIATAVICLTSNQKYNFSKLIFDGMLRHLDAKKKFVMYPRFISIFLDKQLANVPVPLDHFPVNTLTSKVFSFMVKKGKHFSGKVTPLFASMLVQPTEDEGAPSERPSEAQPTPSPAHTSEVPIEPQTDSSPAHTSKVPIEQHTDPSPRPSPSTIIPDSIPESSGGNLGGHSSSDKSLSGNEGEMTLQSVYDLYLSLCAQDDKAEHLEEINQNVVIRSNGQKRYFSTLMRVLSIFDREDLNAVYQLVMDRYQDEIPEGFDRVLWGDLMVMFNPDDEDEFWNSQQDWNIVSWKLHGSSGVHTLVTEAGLVIHMLVEKKYPLRKKVLVQMLKLKLESEEDSTMALELIRFVKKLLAELEPEDSDGDEEDL